MATVKSQKPMRFSKTDAPGFAARRGLTRRPRALPERIFRVPSAAADLEEPVSQPHPEAELAGRYRLKPGSLNRAAVSWRRQPWQVPKF